MARERIGIMGGTFNPIHKGHIAMAKAALTSADLNAVLVLPSGVPPHKREVAPAWDRWRMVCAAVCQEPGLIPCRMELDRQGTTYTVDTLSELKQKYPKADFFYIIGADTLMELHNWRCFETVLKQCSFLVCPRAWHYTPEELNQERRRLEGLGGRFQTIDMELSPVSSSQVRDALAKGEQTPLLPEVVREYCGLKGLYGMRPRFSQAEAWLSRLFDALNTKRFSHSLGVAHTARSLARIHGVDVRKAEEAALLHDCAKCLPVKEQERLCRERSLTQDEEILESGNLMHSLAGAYLAAADYGVEDPDVLRAIACHTSGKVGMTKLDMVVYLADKIEPTRAAFPLLSKVRMMAPLSLEKAMITSIEGTVKHVQESGKKVHPQTLETLHWLKTPPEAR